MNTTESDLLWQVEKVRKPEQVISQTQKALAYATLQIQHKSCLIYQSKHDEGRLSQLGLL